MAILLHAVLLGAIPRRDAVVGAILSTQASPLASSAAAQTLMSRSTNPGSIAMPPIGFGTCCEEADDSQRQILDALRAGYRLLDTSAHYPSEEILGDALHLAETEGIVQRRDVTVCTKIWFDDMGFDPALASIRRSLERLQTEQLDLVLIHFPGSPDAVQSPKRNRELREQTWRACERAQDDGLVKRIGLSNWTRRHLRETMLSCRTPPSVLQTEVHPRCQPSDLLDACAKQQIQVMAYCPLAHGAATLLKSPSLLRVASEAGRTPSQVALRWSIQKGLVPIPHSNSLARMRENLASLDFALSGSQMALLDAMDVADRASFDPSKIA